MALVSQRTCFKHKRFLLFLFFFSDLFCLTADLSMPQVGYNQNCALEDCIGFAIGNRGIFFLRIFCHAIINLSLINFARNRVSRILTLGLFCINLAALGPHARLIRYLYTPLAINSLH